MSEDWQKWRRSRDRFKPKIDLQQLEQYERVELTEDNVKQLAKKTGRSEFSLRNLVSEAEAKGHRCYLRIPSE